MEIVALAFVHVNAILMYRSGIVATVMSTEMSAAQRRADAPGDASGPNARVIDVINFLSAHPQEAFTLSELAAHLGLSNGSAHRVLTTLTDARFLSRHPKHKTYSLGVALVAIGQAALEKYPGIDVARREMARLAAELKVQCIATALVEGDRLMLAKAGTPQTHEEVNRVGERQPIVPPIGLGCVAWSGERAIAEFLARVPVPLDDAMRAHIQASFRAIRQRGYSAGANGPVLRSLRQHTILPVGQPRDAAYWQRIHDHVARLTPNEVQLLDLADAAGEGICYMTAPVFSPSGTVDLELTLSGMPIGMSTADMERYGERLRSAAAIIMNETHGRIPHF